MIRAVRGEDAEVTIGSRSERETGEFGTPLPDPLLLRSICALTIKIRIKIGRDGMAMSGEMMVGAAVAMRFGMEIAILDINSDCHADIGISGKLLARSCGGRGASKTECGGVLTFDHRRGHLNFDGAAIAGISHKIPDSRRAWNRRTQRREIERGNKTTSVDPDAKAFGKDMALHGYGWMEVCREDALVFGEDAAEIEADAGH